MLVRSSASPSAAYGAVGLLVVVGVGVVPRLGQELLPEFKERDFLMHWVTKPRTPRIAEEVRITTASAEELQAIPGVRNFGSHIGQALLADEPYGIVLRGELDQRRRNGRLRQPRCAAIQEVVDGYPGIDRDVQTYLKERIREVLTGSSETIVVQIFGDDLDVAARDRRARSRTMMADVDGVDRGERRAAHRGPPGRGRLVDLERQSSSA